MEAKKTVKEKKNREKGKNLIIRNRYDTRNREAKKRTKLRQRKKILQAKVKRNVKEQDSQAKMNDANVN